MQLAETAFSKACAEHRHRQRSRFTLWLSALRTGEPDHQVDVASDFVVGRMSLNVRLRARNQKSETRDYRSENKSQIANDKFHISNEQRSAANDQWSTINGQRSTSNDQ